MQNNPFPSRQTLLTRRQFLKAALVGLGGALAASYPVFIERYWVTVNRYRVALPGLPPAFDGLRVAQLSDIHAGPWSPDGWLRGLMRTVMNLHADLIVCTGDTVREKNGTTQLDRIWPLLAGLRAPLGVYSVLGNHDHWADTERSLYWLEKSGQNLRHKVVRLERDGQPLWLAGAGDLWEDDLGLEVALANIPPDQARVVLAHNPDSFDVPFSGRVDLMLCGHTHGGQVRLPIIGAPMVPVNNKTYVSGLLNLSRGAMFISRGIGWSGVPVRFNCSPEIALLELVRPN